VGDPVAARRLIGELFAAALAANDPEQVVADALSLHNGSLSVDRREVPLVGQLVVVAIGKAAEPMALGAVAALGNRIDAGYLVTKEGHSSSVLDRRFQVWEAGHPVPDRRGLEATRATLDGLAGLGERDVVLALISGGGSALFEAPREPVTLDDVARITEMLLRAGAPIQDLNAVRIPLSRVKGGGLRRATRAGRFVTLILSDVLGNDPAIIASGLTAPSTLTGAGALKVLRRYGLDADIPDRVRHVLTAGDPIAWAEFDRDILTIVADNDRAVDAAAARAAGLELPVEVVWRRREGEAADLGRAWVDMLRSRIGPRVLLGGGESTVTVRGEGRGGRNTEFAVAAAIALDQLGLDEWTVASLATDGQDANTGAAGAVVDRGSIARAEKLGLDPRRALERNDSATILDATGDLVVTGPTGTNVNDLYIAVALTDDPDRALL
jgi:glycerate-2-kinase